MLPEMLDVAARNAADAGVQRRVAAGRTGKFRR
jgi:hypothetical protein